MARKNKTTEATPSMSRKREALLLGIGVLGSGVMNADNDIKGSGNGRKVLVAAVRAGGRRVSKL